MESMNGGIDPAIVDLHTHILPGIDDGPAELVGSVAMADIAQADGVAVLVATPHLRPDYPAVIPAELPQRIAETQAAFGRYAIDVLIARGAEIDLHVALEMDADALREVTLGGNGLDLLIETPHSNLTDSFEDRIAEVQGKGFRVTLAHPELNPDLQTTPGRVGRLVAGGALVQLSASSLIARRRSRARSAALGLLEAGWAHVVASDAHAPRWRPPTLKSQVDECIRSHREWAGVLQWAISAAPSAILAGAPLPPRPAVERRRRLMSRR